MSSDLKSLGFLVLWTLAASLIAWLAFNRLSIAHETRRFEIIFHGLQEDKWPLIFNAAQVFLTIGAGLATLMAAIGCIWILKAVWERFG